MMVKENNILLQGYMVSLKDNNNNSIAIQIEKVLADK